MANYLVKQCSTGIDYVITAGTLSNGDVIVFYLGEEFACGTVISVTGAAYDYVYATTSTNCCECQSGLTDSLFLGFTTCEGDLSLDIDGGNFCNDYGLPFTGQVYTLDYGGSYLCATYTGLTFSGNSGYTYNNGPFTSCSQCTTPSPTPTPTTEPGKGATINPLYYYGDLSSANAPLSAGTPTEICLEKCDQSVVSVDPPHPVWTNLGGKAVVQLNMVSLGGPFGLNG
jgi:hypothetical protein